VTAANGRVFRSTRSAQRGRLRSGRPSRARGACAPYQGASRRCTGRARRHLMPLCRSTSAFPFWTSSAPPASQAPRHARPPRDARPPRGARPAAALRRRVHPAPAPAEARHATPTQRWSRRFLRSKRVSAPWSRRSCFRCSRGASSSARSAPAHAARSAARGPQQRAAPRRAPPTRRRAQVCGTPTVDLAQLRRITVHNLPGGERCASAPPPRTRTKRGFRAQQDRAPRRGVPSPRVRGCH
jgi:hypothetical protein